MRKIVSQLFYSLDGVVGSPEKWVFDLVDEEAGGFVDQLTDRQDTVLLGRKTFDFWSTYWPGSDDGFAPFINNVNKYVISTTLEKPEWQNTKLINQDVYAKVAKLKTQPGKDIGIHGSITLVRSLLEHNLVDQLALIVFPVLAGKGERLGEGLEKKHKLRLVESQKTQKGVMLLIYQPIEND